MTDFLIAIVFIFLFIGISVNCADMKDPKETQSSQSTSRNDVPVSKKKRAESSVSEGSDHDEGISEISNSGGLGGQGGMGGPAVTFEGGPNAINVIVFNANIGNLGNLDLAKLLKGVVTRVTDDNGNVIHTNKKKNEKTDSIL